MESSPLPLSSWESFYVIVGSSAGALTGLQFVVITLGKELDVLGSGHATRAFGTPTVVHFCMVLLIAAILSAPWPGVFAPALLLSACGGAGTVYAVVVLNRARQQTDYKPVIEDWLFHVVFPLLSYVALLLFGVMLGQGPTLSLFGVATVALALLFIGIHNAWDTVVYLTQQPPAANRPRK